MRGVENKRVLPIPFRISHNVFLLCTAVYTMSVLSELWSEKGHAQNHGKNPHSALMTPVYDSFDPDTRSLAGLVHGLLAWDTYLTVLLPPGVNGIITVLTNSCGQIFTFQINGPEAIFVGDGE